jgi:hypothetical protein
MTLRAGVALDILTVDLNADISVYGITKFKPTSYWQSHTAIVLNLV